MQATDALTVSRRPLDLEDYIDIARRHKALILGPTFAALVISVVVAFLWPDTYQSAAVIKVVPQQIPQAYVPANVTMEMSSRINAMAQNVVSRAKLTNIIQTLGLYPRERSRLPIDDIIENMRKDIRISNVATVTSGSGKEAVPAFQIAFSYANRTLAMKVVESLSSQFITENLRERQEGSTQTTKFLEDQLDLSRKELEALEQRLTEFRLKNSGHLPDQMQQNMQQLNQLETRLSNLNASLSRSNQDKMVLESQKRLLESQLRSLAPPQDQMVQAAKSERLAEMERQIQQGENTLAALREHYKDSYPEVERQKSYVAGLIKQRDSVLKEESSRKPEQPQAAAPRTSNPQFLREQRELEINIQRANTLVQSKEVEMDEIRKEITQVNAAIKAYEGRIEGTPVSDQQYTELVRDRDLAKSKYEEMSRRKSQSAVATDIEKRSQGERLELLDPASLPQTPTEPKRPVLVAMGTAVGLLIGLVLAGAGEMKDTSLKNLKDVRAYTQLNILGVAPLLENDLVVRRRRRLAWLAWSTAVLVGAFIMTGSIVYYYTFRV